MPKKAPGWFFVIARNAALGIVRREARAKRHLEPVSPDLTRFAAPQGAPDSQMEDEAFAGDLRECIARLPRLQRAILEADLQTGDVAEASDLVERLRTTSNSVYVSRSMARKSLRKCLARRGYRFWEGRSTSDGDTLA